jgi:hypothetical protein
LCLFLAGVRPWLSGGELSTVGFKLKVAPYQPAGVQQEPEAIKGYQGKNPCNFCSLTAIQLGINWHSPG